MSRFRAALLIVIIAMAPASLAADADAISVDLKSAAQLALENNPRLSSASASVDISKAVVDKARSALYPTIGAEAGYSYLSKETIFGTTPIMEHSTEANRLHLQQVVYSAGAVQAGIRQARHAYIATTHGTQAAQAEVLTNVAVAYFRARQAAENIDVAVASEKSLAAGYDSAKKLHEAGVVTNSDVLRAQVALTSAKSSLIEARNGYEVALAALRTAIGLPLGHTIKLAPDAADAPPETLISEPPADRPEIAAATAAVQAADEAKTAAASGRQPTVALFADYYNQPVGAQFPRLSNTLMAGVMVKLNVFDGGMTRANIDEANAASIKARHDLAAQQQQVELEQQTAKLNLSSAQAKVETTATQVQSAQESLRSLQIGYNEGIAPLTDVLSAEAALTAARVSRLAAVYDVKIAAVNLMRAYGHSHGLAQ